MAHDLSAAALDLLRSAPAKNELRGFALTTGTGMIALAVMKAFQRELQTALGVLPGFWALWHVSRLRKLNNQPVSAISYTLFVAVGSMRS